MTTSDGQPNPDMIFTPATFIHMHFCSLFFNINALIDIFLQCIADISCCPVQLMIKLTWKIKEVNDIMRIAQSSDQWTLFQKLDKKYNYCTIIALSTKYHNAKLYLE